jgi:hypothetical protein
MSGLNEAMNQLHNSQVQQARKVERERQEELQLLRENRESLNKQIELLIEAQKPSYRKELLVGLFLLLLGITLGIYLPL